MQKTKLKFITVKTNSCIYEQEIKYNAKITRKTKTKKY